MIICSKESLTELLTSCGEGKTRVASIVFREVDLLNSYRDSFIERFMGDGINGVESIAQALNVDNVGEVDCLVFKNGSLIFLYALPNERSIPYHQAMLCTQIDTLLDSSPISEAAFMLGISDKLRNAIDAEGTGIPASAGQSKKIVSERKASEVDPLDEWISSLKVIG